MTKREQILFNDALHKMKVRDTELRIRRKLEYRLNSLNGMVIKDQMPVLLKLEEALSG